jgi:hypothetical protein
VNDRIGLRGRHEPDTLKKHVIYILFILEAHPMNEESEGGNDVVTCPESYSTVRFQI